MTLNSQSQPMSQLVLRSGVELVAVTALVFATGWGGVRLAEVMHRHPVGPSKSGIIELRIVKSDRRGDVTFEEGSGYAGWWHCRGDWAVEWRVAPKLPGRYRVEVRVATSERTPDRLLEVTIGDQVLAATVPDTGGAAKWKTLDAGLITLEAKACSLVVRPGSAAPANLNVKSVTLRPVEASQ